MQRKEEQCAGKRTRRIEKLTKCQAFEENARMLHGNFKRDCPGRKRHAMQVQVTTKDSSQRPLEGNTRRGKLRRYML